MNFFLNNHNIIEILNLENDTVMFNFLGKYKNSTDFFKRKDDFDEKTCKKLVELFEKVSILYLNYRNLKKYH